MLCVLLIVLSIVYSIYEIKIRYIECIYMFMWMYIQYAKPQSNEAFNSRDINC